MGSGAVTLQNPLPVISSVSPTTIGTGSFLITIVGTGFVKTSAVTFGGTTLTTMYVSPTELDAVGSATSAQIGTVTITVTESRSGRIDLRFVDREGGDRWIDGDNGSGGALPGAVEFRADTGAGEPGAADRVRRIPADAT